MNGKPTFSIPIPRQGKRPKKRAFTDLIYGNSKLDSMPLNLRPSPVKVPEGCTLSIPIIMERNERNVLAVRMRTMEDDLVASAVAINRTPSNRAIRMANAIVLEELLSTGKFGSATQLASKLGVSQPHLTEMLNLLNLPPDEIERRLFETRATR